MFPVLIIAPKIYLPVIFGVSMILTELIAHRSQYIKRISYHIEMNGEPHPMHQNAKPGTSITNYNEIKVSYDGYVKDFPNNNYKLITHTARVKGYFFPHVLGSWENVVIEENKH